MKTSELIGPALDWAVAKCEGLRVGFVNTSEGPESCHWVETWEGDDDLSIPKYSTDWSQGGPLIEREAIDTYKFNKVLWVAECHGVMRKGPTPLIAAMRCYVASKLGDEIEIPEELK